LFFLKKNKQSRKNYTRVVCAGDVSVRTNAPFACWTWIRFVHSIRKKGKQSSSFNNGVLEHGRSSQKNNGIPKSLLRRRFLPRRCFSETTPLRLLRLPFSPLPRRFSQCFPGLSNFFLLFLILYIIELFCFN
jgi:hypothetical protein